MIFNGTTIFASLTELFVLLTAFAVFPPRAAVYLNDWGLSITNSTLLAGTSSILNCHKLHGISEKLSLYSIKFYIGIAMQIWFASSTNTSLIFVVYVENSTQFLNATSVSFLAATVIFPVAKINASE